MRHPEVPPQLRGTYAGLADRAGDRASPAPGRHRGRADAGARLRRRPHLVEKGLHNYWGYNTIGFFAPDMRYSAIGRISEFKTMVKTLHSAGIEVILDVVYNHTAEGNQLGPTLSLPRHRQCLLLPPEPEDPRYYMDFTGTGNTLNLQHPRVLQLIMDCLRYWVLEMHVDGFRFDLASALARELYDVDRLGSFFDTIGQDPVLSQVKLIAEPWDVGEGGYQVGNFPPGWNEWNDKYRDTMRAYWKGDGGLIGDFARRFTGSSDLYEASGRKPHASINFVTAHDGFTLQDLVSYNEKHNEANGEDNRDGNDNNLSWNCGVEGPDRRPGDQRAARAAEAQSARHAAAVAGRADAARRRRVRPHARAATTTPTARTTRPPGSTGSWTRSRSSSSISSAQVIALRRAHPVFSRRRFLQGRRGRGGRAQGDHLAHARRQRDDRDRVEPGFRALPGRVSCRARLSSASTGAAAPSRTTTSCCCSTRITNSFRSSCRRFRTGKRWQTVLDTAASQDRSRSKRYASRQPNTPCRAARSRCCVESARTDEPAQRHACPSGRN